MSYVYRAEEIETGRIVALKILLPRLSRDPPSVERLRREATIAMRLDHPNVCPILRLGETPERLIYLVMPFLEGRAAERARGPPGPVLPRRGRAAADPDVPRAPARARAADHPSRPQAREHHAGSAAREKPGGRCRSSGAVVMDFGLAKERRAGSEVAKLTATGIVLGTPGVHEPGADSRQAARRAERRLCARGAGVRALHRPAAVPRQVGPGDDDRPAARSAAASSGK